MSWGAVYSKSYFGVTSSTNGWGFFYPAAVKAKQLLTSLTTIFTDTIQYLTDQITYT